MQETAIPLPPPQSESALVTGWLRAPALSAAAQQRASAIAAEMVQQLPAQGSLADDLMQTYPLNSREGMALMSLAEAMLRVPDAETRDALLHDKLPGRHWTVEGGSGRVRLTGAAMAALSGTLAAERDTLTAAMVRLGMPVVRRMVQQAIQLFGRQFVLAETIDAALQRAADAEGVLFSFDMLGEGARDDATAERYLTSYEDAIRRIGRAAQQDKVHANHGVSVKLSALHARYETRQRETVHKVLLPRVLHLAQLAKRHNIPMTIDAEEMARLPLSLEIIQRLLTAPQLADYHGLGAAVQAYGLRAAAVLDTLFALAHAQRRGFAIRLIKGAYWDTEIKTAQQKGLDTFPVLTRKAHTDVSFLQQARRLLHAPPQVLPQIASHNATTLAAVAVMAEQGKHRMEVQRLYGMGDALHAVFRQRFGHPLRVYAPVGSHDDLLAYLVRRLLENGANSSFIHRLREKRVPLQELVAQPYAQLAAAHGEAPPIRSGSELFLPQRTNSRGFDLDCPHTLHTLAALRAPHLQDTPHAEGACSAEDAARAWTLLRDGGDWHSRSAVQRGEIIRRIAQVYMQHGGKLFALLAQEAGKTVEDAVDELREAADFCLYYGAQAAQLPTDAAPRGTVLAISPWNFPLAIFTGQIVAALAAGNTVLAKPAEQTPQLAQCAVSLMYEAGVPPQALQCVTGEGETLGAALVREGMADMVVFTGSTATARAIQRGIAASAKPAAPLLAETGGINAMVVDSSALPEQAVDDILASAFRSAGQRCSALRVLYVQEDIADRVLTMLTGAAAQLKVGDPLDMATDIGPVIDAAAQREIRAYLAARHTQVLWQGEAPAHGCFVPPTILRVRGIAEVQREVFGPVLHVASVAAAEIEKTLAAINRHGYGLTFGLHSRMETRQQHAAEVMQMGNVYINRNQVGAVVGSQPFGGCGLSGTGPKAGGPLYLYAFLRCSAADINAGEQTLPGPDGEKNLYHTLPRGRVLCIAKSAAAAGKMLDTAKKAGNTAAWAPELPQELSAIDAVMCAADDANLPAMRQQLAASEGAIIPLISDEGGQVWLWREKHISHDTTDLGGNVSLLAVSG